MVNATYFKSGTDAVPLGGITSRPATIRAGQLSLIIPNATMPGPPTSGTVLVNLGKSIEPAIRGFLLLTELETRLHPAL
jgi:hypothetical protein